MKKLLSLLLGLVISAGVVFADESLSFVYINGSNNNDVRMKTWYENGVRKLHPVLRKKFLKNREIKRYEKLSSENLIIKEDPVIFF